MNFAEPLQLAGIRTVVGRGGTVSRLVCIWLAFVALGCSLASPPPLWELPPPPARDAAVVDPARLHRATLANGLEVLIYQDDRFPAFDACSDRVFV